jgi:CheY-like chemotaxis protein
VTVDNGDDAVIRAREAHPDLILADVVMPGKSGYEVCEAIKADPELRHIPVLLLSGTFEAFDEERAARAGAAGHVAKPFEAQSLVDQVNQLLAETPPKLPKAVPVAAAAPMEVAAAPVASREPDSFDFFDDDLSELDLPIAAASADAQTPELELSDEAFSMADEDFAPMQPTPSAQSTPSKSAAADSGFVGGGELYPDRTVAILPDEPSAAAAVPPTAVSTPMLSDESDLDAAELVALTEDDADDSFMTVDPASTADEAFDFSFESESTAPESIAARAKADAPVDAAALDELVEDAVLDPIGATGFDVDPLAADDENADAPVVELEAYDEIADSTASQRITPA